MRNQLLASEFQIEEIQLDLEDERRKHQRTKANYGSVSLQWQDVSQELMAKNKEVWKTRG